MFVVSIMPSDSKLRDVGCSSGGGEGWADLVQVGNDERLISSEDLIVVINVKRARRNAGITGIYLLLSIK